MATSLTLSEPRHSALLQSFSEAVDRGDSAAVKISALVFLFGEHSPSTLENQRGQAVIQYLLESQYPVSNACIVASPSATFIFHGKDHTIVLPPSPPSSQQITVTSDFESWKASVKRAFEGKSVGVAMRELDIQEGSFATDAIHFLKSEAGLDLVESAPLFGELLFVKDEAAIASIEKASGLSSTIFRRYVRGLIESQISTPNPNTLLQIREQLCEKLQHPETIDGLESLNTKEFSMASGLTVCIFQKSVYDPKIQVDDEDLKKVCAVPLNPQVLIARYGTKHMGYTSFIARTILVESKVSEKHKEAYNFVFFVSSKVIEKLTAGTPLKKVYEEVMDAAVEKDPELASHLIKSFGFSTGLLVLESRGTISEKGTAVVQNGMCFVVRIVLQGVPDDGESIFNIELADTVLIRGDVGELRTKVFRKLEDVLYEVDEEDSEKNFRTRDLSKITRQGASGSVIVSREEQREQQLKSLLNELHAEFLASGGKKSNQSSLEEVSTYEIGRLALGDIVLDSTVPEEAKSSIFIQVNKKVAWFPVFGKPCPFHISTISKVENKVEGNRYLFVVTFHSLQEANIAFRLNRTKAFLKELSYASKKDIFTEIQIAIQAIQQNIKNEDANRKRNLNTSTGGKLQILSNSVRLPQLKIRPPITIGRKTQGCVGNLELHQNGLRFTYLGGAPIDILFDNVKHIIFQPAVNSVIVCYHVTLKKAVDVGKKPFTEIQFIAEVMESSEAATGIRKSYEEEVMAEERDEARVRETNKQFVTFARAVEERSKIRTQFPSNNISFDGVHTKSMVTFKASREVLWAVTEWPPFTLSVSEVEVVSLERVAPGISTFDLAFILKDYNKPVITINSIPRKNLELIKDWCLSVRLYYMETSVNPNWKVTMKTIRDDDEWNPWLPDGGWSILNEDPEDEESEESDSTYNEEDEETTEDSSSWLEDEESDVSSGSESEESSADWDELDRRAQAHDRKKRYSDDDDDERPRKRARTTQPPVALAPSTRSSAFPHNAAPPPRRF